MVTARRLATFVSLSVVARALHTTPAGWATAEEVGRPYPGADLIPGGEHSATMAVTIEAPPASAWPWLVQIGADRAGWYSWDRLDNWGLPSAERVHPEWQEIAVGEHLAAKPDGAPVRHRGSAARLEHPAALPAEALGSGPRQSARCLALSGFNRQGGDDSREAHWRWSCGAGRHGCGVLPVSARQAHELGCERGGGDRGGRRRRIAAAREHRRDPRGRDRRAPIGNLAVACPDGAGTRRRLHLRLDRASPRRRHPQRRPRRPRTPEPQGRRRDTDARLRDARRATRQRAGDGHSLEQRRLGLVVRAANDKRTHPADQPKPLRHLRLDGQGLARLPRYGAGVVADGAEDAAHDQAARRASRPDTDPRMSTS